MESTERASSTSTEKKTPSQRRKNNTHILSQHSMCSMEKGNIQNGHKPFIHINLPYISLFCCSLMIKKNNNNKLKK